MKALQSTKKQLKLFNFLKNKMGPKGILFFQETHSSVETENKGSDGLKGKVYYPRGTINSCGVLIKFCGNLNICVKNKVNDNDGRVLILEATIDGFNYLLIILYNANIEKEQLATIKKPLN